MAKSLSTEGILKQVNRRLKEYYDFDQKHGTKLYDQLVAHVDDLVSYQDRRLTKDNGGRADKWTTHPELRVGFEAKMPKQKGYKQALEDMKTLEPDKYENLLKQLDTSASAVDYIKKAVTKQSDYWAKKEQEAKNAGTTLEVPRFIDEILRDIPTVKQKLKEIAFDKALSEVKTEDEWKALESTREATLKKRLTVDEQNEAIIRAKQLQSTTDTFRNKYATSATRKAGFKEAIEKLYEDESANAYLIGQLGRHEKWTPTLMSEVVSVAEAMEQLQAEAIKKTESAKDLKETDWFKIF